VIGQRGTESVIGVGAVLARRAVYMVGDSMEPRYRAGELLYVHPGRPPTRGSYVLVELKDGHALVKELVKADDQEVVVRQLNPERRLRFARRDVVRVVRVVGAVEHS
jgi:phage repressor protein C with HTH and peptisase S24 domain